MKARIGVAVVACSLGIGLSSIYGGACSSFRTSPVPEPAADRIKISHSVHFKAEVECLACHEEIYDAENLDANYRPLEKVCMQCHKDKKEANNCGFCHTDVKRAAPYPKRVRLVRISHSFHIEEVKEDCSVCHQQLPEPGEPRHLTPPMDRCLSCHKHQSEFNSARCRHCHTDVGLEGLRPTSVFSHANGFVDTHRVIARGTAHVCAQCHDQTFCSDCHAQTVAAPASILFADRVERTFIHRSDFVSRHMIEAGQDPGRCRRCHGSTFCQSCHTPQNLTPQAVNPRDPHPVGWAFPGSADFHGDAARRDIVSCAACHDNGAKSICIDCHKVGGIGGNPHPSSWLNRHDESEIQGHVMCRYCHL